MDLVERCGIAGNQEAMAGFGFLCGGKRLSGSELAD